MTHRLHSRRGVSLATASIYHGGLGSCQENGYVVGVRVQRYCVLRLLASVHVSVVVAARGEARMAAARAGDPRRGHGGERARQGADTSRPHCSSTDGATQTRRGHRTGVPWTVGNASSVLRALRVTDKLPPNAAQHVLLVRSLAKAPGSRSAAMGRNHGASNRRAWLRVGCGRQRGTFTCNYDTISILTGLVLDI